MQLIDNTDKMLSGSISKTGDFEMYKKVIGVSSSNLTPNTQGIVPLANTSSLEKEKIEPEISEQVMESLDLGQDEVEEKRDIPSIDLGSLTMESKDNKPDLQGAVPVSVSDTSALESIDLPKIPSLDSPIESQNVDEKKEVIPDLKLPNFSDTKLDIPAVPEASSEMFIDSAIPSLENSDVKSDLPGADVEIPSNDLPKLDSTVDDNMNVYVNDKFKNLNVRKEEMLRKIMSFISDEIDLYLSETQSSELSNGTDKTKSSSEEVKTPDMTNMVDNMINRIQDNPGLPEEEGKLSL